MTDKEVKTGTETTLTCSLTGLGAAVTIAWWEGGNKALADSGGECSARKSQGRCLHVNDFT